jgi:hypothetical protein
MRRAVLLGTVVLSMLAIAAPVGAQAPGAPAGSGEAADAAGVI